MTPRRVVLGFARRVSDEGVLLYLPGARVFHNGLTSGEEAAVRDLVLARNVEGLGIVAEWLLRSRAVVLRIEWEDACH
jgi:hypothetical protein